MEAASMSSPVVVVGSGAIGGTIGAHLARAGTPTVLVDRNRAHVAAMRQRGLSIEGPAAQFTVPVEALAPEETDRLRGTAEIVLVCTKILDTDAAATLAASLLRPDGFAVSIQNGLNGEALAAAVGPERTVLAFVNFSADLLEPAVIHYAGPATMAVGELDHRLTPRLGRVAELLAPLQPVRVTERVDGYLWSKMAYGAMLFATAMTDETMADCVDHPQYRWVLLAVAKESVSLARAQGIPLAPFDGWDPAALDDAAAAARMMDGLSAVMRRNTKVRSGVWRDLAVHGRRTEVDEFLPVLELADRLGVAMPLTRAMVARIHDLEQGRMPRGLHNLEHLRQVGRAAAGTATA
jgi:2-dehydropantoate 2-reductase